MDTSKVPEAGVYARCSVCSSVFFVGRPSAAVAEVGAAGRSETREEPWAAPVPETTPWTPPAPSDFELVHEPASEPAAFESGPEPAGPEPIAPTSVLETPSLDAEPYGLDVPGTDEPLRTGPVEPAESVTVTEAAPAPVAGAPEPSTAPAGAFTFGRRDPHDKARRLARVLVSDMIMYNSERHSRAIAAGSLREDFDDEIKKSWQEYVEQVGEEIARGTSYFDDALNEILARGQRVFP